MRKERDSNPRSGGAEVDMTSDGEIVLEGSLVSCLILLSQASFRARRSPFLSGWKLAGRACLPGYTELGSLLHANLSIGKTSLIQIKGLLI
nr:hypothetical protein Iba_chr13dCG4380 [Ipomoea batatas]